MAIKKSELYSFLCAICFAPRGIMVADLEQLEFKITKAEQLKKDMMQEL